MFALAQLQIGYPWWSPMGIWIYFYLFNAIATYLFLAFYFHAKLQRDYTADVELMDKEEAEQALREAKK